ncbi:5-(carboxyamino)imidazole ribonucleotide synthase [Rubinisphaera margarita]|uniref:5-(carboxyamino)imidazole ribonucleotide synthase n=1 Tax=Rubinisphaera margarita TaxID=2909586 RepID=UPI001EE8EE48|nr:5-(carboxyamino)imidazole ribonucleotide synthase [Rubinisphaera margarita]MCG6158532.1 5-(carboxyamino)imidazole ribonucleotide synthase [Rubinisphaera margarita]
MIRQSRTIDPGATLGVLGGGQLGRMFAQSAHRLGYHVHTFSDEENSPCGQVADREFVGAYDDIDAIEQFAKGVDVITFEFENISSEAAQAIERIVPVRPGGEVLHISQNRIREKSTLAEAGLPVTPFRPIRTEDELQNALNELGTPSILKTAFGGYDGKGQIALSKPEEALPAWKELGQVEAVLEKKIDFRCEVSVVGVRDQWGNFTGCGPILNEHRNHILDLSVFPEPSVSDLEADAVAICRGVLEKLNVVGVMCVEMFVTTDNRILINEVAPRPHNSGHLTINACLSSQFEQQVRAICGLPLGDMIPLKPSAMINLLGDVWTGGVPNWAEALKHPEATLHLYGKREPRVGRKMGHLTVLSDTAEEAIDIARQARAALQNHSNEPRS